MKAIGYTKNYKKYITNEKKKIKRSNCKVYLKILSITLSSILHL